MTSEIGVRTPPEAKAVPLRVSLPNFVRVLRDLFQVSNAHLRELVQNALEATYQAELAGHVTNRRVDIRTNPARRILTVTDHGIGMTGGDLTEKLTQVFVSGWPKGERNTLGIGQFGFGFFSAYLVSDSVSVLSRPRLGGEDPHRWSLRVSAGEATLRRAGRRVPFGTTVSLRIRPGCESACDTESILDDLRTHYLYSPYAIYVDDVPLGVPTPEGWQEQLASPGGYAVASDWLVQRHSWSTEPLAVQPFQIQNGGWLVIVPDNVIAPAVTVYRRGIFVTETELIPEPYNYFFSGLLDGRNLRIKPDRETLYQDDSYYQLRRRLLAECKGTLKRMAMTEKRRLAKIFAAHRSVLTTCMLQDEEMCSALGDSLPLRRYFPDRRTGNDTVTLAEILTAPSGRDGVVWADNPEADELFADRARHLGSVPVLLQDQRDRSLVAAICSLRSVPMRHVSQSFAHQMLQKARHEPALEELFAPALGDGWQICCGEDVDTRFPIRLVGLTPALGADDMWDEGPFDLEDDSFNWDEVEDEPSERAEPERIAIINLSSPIIQEFRTANGQMSRADRLTFARVMVSMARLLARVDVGAAEFESLNRDVLDVLHKAVIR